MKKRNDRVSEMLPEYDFSGGVRGKYAKRYAKGCNVVVLDPDVAKEFHSSSDVNNTLRAVARIAHARKPRAKRLSS